jgi:hypothetical protein
MKFEKGRSGNPQGRPKGSKGKASEELRELILDFIDRNLPSIQENYDQLDPKEKLTFLEKLFSFALPKMQAVRMEVENVNTPPFQIIVQDEETKDLLEDVQRKLKEIDE